MNLILENTSSDVVVISRISRKEADLDWWIEDMNNHIETLKGKNLGLGDDLNVHYWAPILIEAYSTTIQNASTGKL